MPDEKTALRIVKRAVSRRGQKIFQVNGRWGPVDRAYRGLFNVLLGSLTPGYWKPTGNSGGLISGTSRRRTPETPC